MEAKHVFGVQGYHARECGDNFSLCKLYMRYAFYFTRQKYINRVMKRLMEFCNVVAEFTH
jgi:hypothetical protein